MGKQHDTHFSGEAGKPRAIRSMGKSGEGFQADVCIQCGATSEDLKDVQSVLFVRDGDLQDPVQTTGSSQGLVDHSDSIRCSYHHHLGK